MAVSAYHTQRQADAQSDDGEAGRGEDVPAALQDLEALGGWNRNADSGAAAGTVESKKSAPPALSAALEVDQFAAWLLAWLARGAPGRDRLEGKCAIRRAPAQGLAVVFGAAGLGVVLITGVKSCCRELKPGPVEGIVVDGGFRCPGSHPRSTNGSAGRFACRRRRRVVRGSTRDHRHGAGNTRGRAHPRKQCGRPDTSCHRCRSPASPMLLPSPRFCCPSRH